MEEDAAFAGLGQCRMDELTSIEGNAFIHGEILVRPQEHVGRVLERHPVQHYILFFFE